MRTVKEHGILFKAEMVQALLWAQNPKTQTRRIVKFDKVIHGGEGEVMPHTAWVDTGYQGDRFGNVDCVKVDYSDETTQRYFPKWKSGDHLWVKETFAPHPEFDCQTVYRADPGGDYTAQGDFKWKPSIFMPRSRSRITLEVLSVRAERLNEISDADAEAEGIQFMRDIPDADETLTAVTLYKILWESINGEGSWANNPMVFVTTFKRIVAEGISILGAVDHVANIENTCPKFDIEPYSIENFQNRVPISECFDTTIPKNPT